jgi:hypothetical protein
MVVFALYSFATVQLEDPQDEEIEQNDAASDSNVNENHLARKLFFVSSDFL